MDQQQDQEQPDQEQPARRIGGATVQITPLRSYAERWDLATAAGVNVQRACAAALGLSWPRLRRLGPTYTGDAIAYGGAVIDYLCEREPDCYPRVIEAGAEALRIATTGLITNAEVKARADFSEATPDTTTS